MELAANHVLHLPDLRFVQWCEQTFGVNRGVYNTIDSWFYAKGIKDIVQRRRCISQFLSVQTAQFQGRKVKFGVGGLTTCLNHYWSSLETNKLNYFAG